MKGGAKQRDSNNGIPFDGPAGDFFTTYRITGKGKDRKKVRSGRGRAKKKGMEKGKNHNKEKERNTGRLNANAGSSLRKKKITRGR